MPAATSTTSPSRLEPSAPEVLAVRSFNRFYTRRIGALQKGLLESDYTLTEVRVLYELAHHDALTAADLIALLDLDASYLSRILQRFGQSGFLRKSPSPHDRRSVLLSLTPQGRAAFAPLEARSGEEIAAMLQNLPPPRRAQMLAAMNTVEAALSPQGQDAAERGAISLRAHRPGDMGWITHRQAVLYAAEYGWNEEFEALVAGITARFIQKFDSERERCWIAESADGRILGSIFLMKKSKSVAQLRLLYVEPDARGMRLGHRLVDACLDHARARGYKKMVLWTNDTLTAARRIYQQKGFVLVNEEKHESFGHQLVGQFWELAL
jgi:DNA-binding MarR family transcriptional regulator/GNAT superfamily N-acetyltransferase